MKLLFPFCALLTLPAISLPAQEEASFRLPHTLPTARAEEVANVIMGLQQSSLHLESFAAEYMTLQSNQESDGKLQFFYEAPGKAKITTQGPSGSGQYIFNSGKVHILYREPEGTFYSAFDTNILERALTESMELLSRELGSDAGYFAPQHAGGLVFGISTQPASHLHGATAAFKVSWSPSAWQGGLRREPVLSWLEQLRIDSDKFSLDPTHAAFNMPNDMEVLLSRDSGFVEAIRYQEKGVRKEMRLAHLNTRATFGKDEFSLPEYDRAWEWKPWVAIQYLSVYRHRLLSETMNRLALANNVPDHKAQEAAQKAFQHFYESSLAKAFQGELDHIYYYVEKLVGWSASCFTGSEQGELARDFTRERVGRVISERKNRLLQHFLDAGAMVQRDQLDVPSAYEYGTDVEGGLRSNDFILQIENRILEAQMEKHLLGPIRNRFWERLEYPFSLLD